MQDAYFKSFASQADLPDATLSLEAFLNINLFPEDFEKKSFSLSTFDIQIIHDPSYLLG